jgi:hypothetical protein
MSDHPRRRHYGEFSGTPPPGPLALVHGNCQAESLRVLLAGSPRFPARPVRIPPVHELTGADLPHLHALLRRTTHLFAQPVRDGYRDLPLGTAELAAHAPHARVVRWPVIRHPALHPWSAIVRHPRDPAAVPPVVPYHDLRILAEAAGHERTDPAPGALRTIGERGIAELARRERRDADVGVSDLLAGLGAGAAHTLNHPGNPVLIALARRLQEAMAARSPRTGGSPSTFCARWCSPTRSCASGHWSCTEPATPARPGAHRCRVRPVCLTRSGDTSRSG